MVAIERLRLLVVPSRQALPWRWDLAQLQNLMPQYQVPFVADWLARAIRAPA